MKNKKTLLLALSTLIIPSIIASEYVVTLGSKHAFTVTEFIAPENTTPPVVTPPENIEFSEFSSTASFNSYYGNTELNTILQQPFADTGTVGFLAYHGGGFQFELAAAKTVTSYKIRAYPDVQAYSTNINNWTLEGSNDNTSWDVVDVVSSEANWTNLEVRNFTVDSPAEYLYYKMTLLGSGTYSYGIGFTGFEITGY